MSETALAASKISDLRWLNKARCLESSSSLVELIDLRVRGRALVEAIFYFVLDEIYEEGYSKCGSESGT